MSRHLSTHNISSKSMHAFLSNLANRQTYKQTREKHVPPPLSEVITQNSEDIDTDLCLCGKTQTMSHIVESCPLTKLNGGLSRLHSADEDVVSWLTNYG